MALEAQNNPFTSILLVEAADPEALPDADPAAGQRRLAVGADHLLYLISDSGVKTQVGAAGSVATDAIWDAKGDLAAGTGANTASKLTVGANDTILMADSGQSTGLKWVASQTPSTQAFGDSAAEGTADTYARGDHKHAMPADPGAAYPPPLLSNPASMFSSSTTGLVNTMTAPTAGDCLVMLIYSTGRGCNSITQTNVTWTQRYTGNGNSQYFEVWTAAVSASAGTTATTAFTGANKVYQESFVFSGLSAFTAASIVGSSFTSASVGVATNECNPAAAGDYIICGYSRNSPTSSYGGLSLPWETAVSKDGGQGIAFIARANSAKKIFCWSVPTSSTATFQAFVKVS